MSGWAVSMYYNCLTFDLYGLNVEGETGLRHGMLYILPG